MNGTITLTTVEHDSLAPRPDLLAHKYRPESVDKVKCHSEQAQRLKQWILEFTNVSRNNYAHDDDDSSASDMSEKMVEIQSFCVLLTGPPGVGKTSLVYTVAKELKMHVIESHSSEKRDFRLFSTLKQANQKGKINPIARMFQDAQEKAQSKGPKKKRRKLDELNQSTNTNGGLPLLNSGFSVSGDSSIVLFDDIDVVFEEDGPFLKSLVEFIRDSKRPVVLTATQSIDFIKTILVHFEHIHLAKPMIEDLTQVLKDVCRKEQHYKMAKVAQCRSIARRTNCDIRQCLNRIHFYGDQAASRIEDDNTDVASIVPDLTRLNEFLTSHQDVMAEEVENDSSRDSEKTECNPVDESVDLIACYASGSLTDLIDSRFQFLDRQTLLNRWLQGLPSIRHEEHTSDHELGEQIKRSIMELTLKLYSSSTVSAEQQLEHEKRRRCIHECAMSMGQTINLRTKGRIEPPEVEFYTDIVPMLGAAIKAEAEKRRQPVQLQQPSSNGGSGGGDALSELMTISRRTRRVQSYLDTIGVHLEPEELLHISDTLLTPASLPGVEMEEASDD